MTHNPSEHPSNTIKNQDIIQINFRRSPDHRTPIAGNNPRIKYFLQLGLVTNPQPNISQPYHTHIHQRLRNNEQSTQPSTNTKKRFKLKDHQSLTENDRNENRNEIENESKTNILPKFPTKMIISQSVDGSISPSLSHTHPPINLSPHSSLNLPSLSQKLQKQSSTDSYLLSSTTTTNTKNKRLNRRPRKLSLHSHHRRNSNHENRIRSKSTYSSTSIDTVHSTSGIQQTYSNLNSNRSSISIINSNKTSFEISHNSITKVSTHSRRRSRSYGLKFSPPIYDFFDENSSSNADDCGSGTYTPPYSKNNSILCHASRTPPGYKECHNSMLSHTHTHSNININIKQRRDSDHQQILNRSRKSTDVGSGGVNVNSNNPIFILHSKPPKYRPKSPWHSKPIVIHKNKPRFDVDFRGNVSSNFPESSIIPDEEMIDNSDAMFDMDSD